MWCFSAKFRLARSPIKSAPHNVHRHRRNPILSLLRRFSRKRIHNRRPSCINPFKDERSVIDGAVHMKLLRHIRFVRFHVDQFPRSQNGCSEQDGEFPFLGHTGTPAFKVQDGHAYRFRDTFAVELLLSGVPMERVSVLLGHSSVRVTEKHYALWMRARQDQLEDDLTHAWSRDAFLISQTGGTRRVHGKPRRPN